MTTIQDMVSHNEAIRVGQLRRESAWYKREQKYKREQEWLRENLVTFDCFVRITLEFIDACKERGEKPKIGAKAIAEQIRWKNLTRKRDTEGYIVNNSYITPMAKQFIRLYPQHGGIFEFRS